MPLIDADGVTQPATGEWQGSVLSSSYIADYKPFNFVDGEGVRCSLYVSGCPFKCPGCYNEAAQSFRYGKKYDEELEERIFADVAQPYVAGLSFVGGEPFLATPVLLRIARRLREEFGDEKTIWIWSGYTYEQLLDEGRTRTSSSTCAMFSWTVRLSNGSTTTILPSAVPRTSGLSTSGHPRRKALPSSGRADEGTPKRPYRSSPRQPRAPRVNGLKSAGWSDS
ncbi:4Fe-4S single cluster domain-containing protein [Flaviflexus ciconiae]